MRDRLQSDHQITSAFKIGLQPVERGHNWLAPFDGLSDYLQRKDALISEKPDSVFGDTGGCEVAQSMVFNLIAEHLCEHYPAHYRRMDNRIEFYGGDQIYTASLADESPLLAISRIVADDLVIMQKSEAGWRLAAGSVCFPSAWYLPEKLGLTMANVHRPVPDFADGTRNAMMIERIFDSLAVGETVQRTNWSVYSTDELHLPTHPDLTVTELAKLYLRGEIQTLTKLESGSDILFTIGIHVDPFSEIKHDGDLCGTLARDIARLDEAQLAYKGLSAARKQLHEQLMFHANA